MWFLLIAQSQKETPMISCRVMRRVCLFRYSNWNSWFSIWICSLLFLRILNITSTNVFFPLHQTKHIINHDNPTRRLTLTSADDKFTDTVPYRVNDMVLLIKEGLNCIDPDGQELSLLIDIMANVDEYSPVCVVESLMGHTVNAPRFECIYVRQKGTRKGQFVHNSRFKRNLFSFTGFDEQMNIIRRQRPLVRTGEKHWMSNLKQSRKQIKD